MNEVIHENSSLSQLPVNEVDKRLDSRQQIRLILWEKINCLVMKDKNASYFSKIDRQSLESVQKPFTTNVSSNELGNSPDNRFIPPHILRELVRDATLAQLGDSFANFVFSTALTILMGRGIGFKISDSVLAESLRQSDWWKHQILMFKGKKGFLGNCVEALLLIAWADGWMRLDEFIEIFLSHPPDLDKLNYHRTRKEALIPSVSCVLNELYRRYCATSGE